MKKLVIAGFILALGYSIANPQSRRVPQTGNDKQNNRPATPSPTPAPAPEPEVAILPADADTSESDDVVEVDTRLVTIPVRILDRNNRFVGGLAKESFKIFEDTVEQEIAYFTNESQPFTVALVLDMSYSTTFKINEIQQAAISFIDQLRPEDQVIVISFDEIVHMHCEATSDRGTIYRAIRSTRIATGTSLYEAVAMTMNDRLRSIKGRKAMVLFTDGVDTTSTRSHNGLNLRDAMEIDALIYPIRYDTFADVQAMKNRTNVPFPGSTIPGTTIPGTSIPIPGTTNPMPGTRSPIPGTTHPMPGPTSRAPGPTSPGPPVGGTSGAKGTTIEEYRAAEEYLDQLALRTGGTVYLASSYGNLNKAFTKIASELREFYSIGYYPTSEGVPGKTRRIKVKVSEPNVAVRARDSYVVPKKKKLRTS